MLSSAKSVFLRHFCHRHEHACTSLLKVSTFSSWLPTPSVPQRYHFISTSLLFVPLLSTITFRSLLILRKRSIVPSLHHSTTRSAPIKSAAIYPPVRTSFLASPQDCMRSSADTAALPPNIIVLKLSPPSCYSSPAHPLKQNTSQRHREEHQDRFS